VCGSMAEGGVVGSLWGSGCAIARGLC
jgi:hypothetical protein